MKIEILGSGTSTGIPVIGCSCAVCTSNNPKNKRSRTSIVLTTDTGTNILIDTSPDLRMQALRAGLTRLDAVLFTHTHADHIFGLDDLRAFTFNCPSIPCYAMGIHLEVLKATFPYIFSPDPNYLGGKVAQLSFHEIEPYKPFMIDGEEVLPLLLFHGSLRVLGFKINNVVYATDCNRIPVETKSHIEGAELLILDGLRPTPHSTHFSLPEAIALAEEVHAQQTIFVHMAHQIEHEEWSKKLPPSCALAYDGMVITVS